VALEGVGAIPAPFLAEPALTAPRSDSSVREQNVTGIVEVHGTSVVMAAAPVAELEGSANMMLKVSVSCMSGCDLWGKLVRIVAHNAAVIKEVVLVSSGNARTETPEFMVKVPFEPGEYTWQAVFPAQAKGGVRHEEGSAPFSFTVKPHAVRVTVLDVPSPVTFGNAFGIKLAVRCSGACDLTGLQVEVLNHNGGLAAAGSLGPVPWAAGEGLYGAEIALKAPDQESRYVWHVRLAGQQPGDAHPAATCAFAFSVAGQPEHLVTVEVTDRTTGTPIRGATVILRPATYRGCEYENHSDEGGVARIRVPSGEYRIGAAKSGYKSVQVVMEVAGESVVRAELLPGSDLDDIYG
jgi:hypothetical protein